MRTKQSGNEFDLKKNLAANITYNREKAGLSKADLAKALGVSQASVSHWESGTNSIDINRLSQLCNILDCDIQDMYTPMWARLDNNGVPDNDLTFLVDEFDNKKHSLDTIPLTKNEHDMFLTLMESGIDSIRRLRDKNKQGD